MEIGQKIKQLRIQKGLTLEELASRSELTKGFLSQMERDLTSPSIATLNDILEALGTTLAEFFKEENTELICCETFNDVFDAIAADSNVVALVAIENTIAGSLLHNYELLRNSGVVIVGEQKLRIAHCICCLPEEDWSDLHEVHSHPVALAQCEAFLQQHPELKAVQAEDTALSAKEIMEHLLVISATSGTLQSAQVHTTQIQNHYTISTSTEELFLLELQQQKTE